MKHAIKYLKANLRSLKSCQKQTASTERKMDYAYGIDAIEKAIKAIKQHDKMLDLLKRLDKWFNGSISAVGMDEWMKEQDKLFEQIKKTIGEGRK